MKCNDVKIELSSYVRKELNQQQMEEIKKHLGSCSDCMEDYNMILEMEEMFSQEKIKAKMPEVLEKRLKDKGKAHKRNRVFKLTSAIAALLIFSVVTTATISPAFADFVSNIPGIRYILDSLKDNPTLERAIRNDMMQPIGVKAESWGLNVEFEGFVADDRNIVIFFSVENLRPSTAENIYLTLDKFKIVTTESPIGPLGSRPINEIKPGEKELGYMKILYGSDEWDAILADNIELSISIGSGAETRYLTDISFEVDLEKFEAYSHTIMIDKVITVENQRVHVERLDIKPTEAILLYKAMEGNSKEILMVDFALQDEEGNIYNYQGGSWFGRWDGYRPRMLESPIFVDYRELYLVGGTFNAVKKEEAQVTIDLDARKVLTGPEDIEIKDIYLRNDYLWIELYCLEGSFNNIMPPVRGHAERKDDNGRHFVALGVEGYEEVSGKVTIQLGTHPNTINEKFKIRIK